MTASPRLRDADHAWRSSSFVACHPALTTRSPQAPPSRRALLELVTASKLAAITTATSARPWTTTRQPTAIPTRRSSASTRLSRTTRPAVRVSVTRVSGPECAALAACAILAATVVVIAASCCPGTSTACQLCRARRSVHRGPERGQQQQCPRAQDSPEPERWSQWH